MELRIVIAMICFTMGTEDTNNSICDMYQYGYRGFIILLSVIYSIKDTEY